MHACVRVCMHNTCLCTAALFCSVHRCPQWTKDEAVAARNVSTEVHFYDGGRLSVCTCACVCVQPYSVHLPLFTVNIVSIFSCSSQHSLH